MSTDPKNVAWDTSHIVLKTTITHHNESLLLLKDVKKDPIKTGIGVVVTTAAAPGVTIWGVIALPKRVACVANTNLIKYIAVQ
jgi:hypothetical protein